MNWLIDNWYIVFILIICVVALSFAIIRFFNLPTNKQIANVKEWLKMAVFEAERALGSQTGQLKLRMVYDMAITKFPWIAKMIPFEVFSSWVDDALNWFEYQIQSNEAVKKMLEEK